MLKQRVITAAILATMVVWGVWRLPHTGFALLLTVLVLLGAWEWGRLMALPRSGQWLYCSLMVLLLSIAWWLQGNGLFIWTILLIAGIYWILVVLWLGRYSRQPGRQDSIWLLGVVGIIVLLAPWVALLDLRGDPVFGASHVLFLLVLIWLADSGAYFAGRRWGRHKLAASISPGKTREGALGALAATLIVAIVGMVMLAVPPSHWPWFAGLCLLVVVFSIVGDLFESMLKRQRGVKDSGVLLPGHGGVLDRIDSLTAAAPLFVLGLRLLPG